MSSTIKKRKEPPQSTTLHNFFGSRDNPPKKRNGTTKSRQLMDINELHEVIELDSDDEVKVLHGDQKPDMRHRSSNSNTDVIGIPATDAKAMNIAFRTKSVSPDARLVIVKDDDQVLFGEPSDLLGSSGAITDVYGSDGSPWNASSHLLNESNNIFSAPSSFQSTEDPPLWEDNSSLLPSSSTLRISTSPITSWKINSHSSSILSAQQASSSSSHIRLPISESPSKFTAKLASKSSLHPHANFDAAWDMTTGDDEMDLADPKDCGYEEEDGDLDSNMQEIDIDESLADPGRQSGEGKNGSCPLCGRIFIGLFVSEIQDHVNQCIDSLPANPASPDTLRPPTSALNTLRPLSTLKSPHSAPVSSVPNANAFSVLMSSHVERSAWEEAQVNEDRNFRPTKANGGRRQAPFYKVLQGMPIAVDGFRYGAIPCVTAYFLTHAHSDHYTNLSSNWKHGPIYCSETTANLVIHMLLVDRKWVHALPMDTPTEIPDTGGVKVTLIEANHCPGSCLFLFEGPQTVNAGDSAFKSSYVGSSRIFRYLHCGDFRACPQHVLHPAVKGKRLDHVYLDTTYLDPKYCFPPQPLVISACAELARRIVHGVSPDAEGTDNDGKGTAKQGMRRWFTIEEKAKGKLKSEEKVLVVVGTYLIGKERIVKAIAHALQTKIYCDNRKTAILRCESDPELHGMLTSDPYTAGVHVVPLGMINSDKFQEYMDRWDGRFSKAVGFRPTGWTYTPPAGTDQSPGISAVISRDQKRTFTYADLKPMRNSTPKLMLYGVPYSEHSSFFELTCFALSLNWVKIIATVNVGSQNSRAKIMKWIEKWEAERKRRRKDDEVDSSSIIEYRRGDYW